MTEGDDVAQRETMPDWAALVAWMHDNSANARIGRSSRRVHYRDLKGEIADESHRAVTGGVLSGPVACRAPLAVATLHLGPAGTTRSARYPSLDDWAAVLAFADSLPNADPTDVVMLHGLGIHRSVPSSAGGWLGRWSGADTHFRSLLEDVAEDGWSKLVTWGVGSPLPSDPVGRRERLFDMAVDLMHAMFFGCPCPHQAETFEPQRSVRCGQHHRLASWQPDPDHDLVSFVKWSILSSRGRTDLQANYFVRGLLWALITESPAAWDPTADLVSGPRAFWACDDPVCEGKARYNFWPDACQLGGHPFAPSRHAIRIETGQIVDRHRMVQKAFFKCVVCGNFASRPTATCALNDEHPVKPTRPTAAWVPADPVVAMGEHWPSRHGGLLDETRQSASAEDAWHERDDALDTWRERSPSGDPGDRL
jgi:hypothetical protein